MGRRISSGSSRDGSLTVYGENGVFDMARLPFFFCRIVFVIIFAPEFGFGEDKMTPRPMISDAGYDTAYPITANGDLITLPAQLNERNGSFCFDTGLTIPAFLPPWDSLLSPSIREVTVVQVNAEPSPFSIHSAPKYRVGALSIPSGSETYAVTGRIVDGLRLSGYRINGLVGMSVLRHCIIQINFDRGTLKWLRTFTPTDEIPIRFSGAAPNFTPQAMVVFPGFGFVRFVIDTGSSAAHAGSIEHELFEQLEAAGWISVLEQRVPVSVSTEASTRFVKIGYLSRVAEVDSMPLPDCLFMDAGEGGANTLGMAFLRRFNLTFDFPKRVLYLQPRRNMDRPDRKNLSGLVVSRLSDEPLVHCVVPKSSAADAGVLPKDVLLRINGKEAKHLTWFEIQQELSESGVTIPLTFRRGSRPFEARMALPKITPPTRITLDTSKKKFLPGDE